MLIAGDVGGTKTQLALYTPEGGPRAPVAEAEFQSGSYSGLAPMVQDFLRGSAARPEIGCFDVAGPVTHGAAYLTNLPWQIDVAGLRSTLSLRRVMLLNDLQAVAYAIPHLAAGEFTTVHAGKPKKQGALAVVAPGTGLGEAFLVWNGRRYLPCSSEGGHADFAPASEEQGALWRYIRARFGHASFERVCSGPGIAHIYDFLCETSGVAVDAAFSSRLAAAPDRTPLIAEAALQSPQEQPLAARAVALFIEILAAEAGNLALKVLATGGVYLAGGVPAHLLPLLIDDRFMQPFASKGRFATLLQEMPVHVVTVRAALLGAALVGLASETKEEAAA